MLNQWLCEGLDGPIKIEVDGNLRISNATAVREAVVSGLGICITPIWLIADEIESGAVKVILEDYRPAPLPIHVVFPAGRFRPARVRCFVDFLTAEFEGQSWLL